GGGRGLGLRGEGVGAIVARRSIGRVTEEPVAQEAVAELLAAAMRAPNHNITEPWRFVVLTGDARRAAGRAHAAAVARERPDTAPEALERETARLERAPVVVACVCRPTADDPVVAREGRDAVAAAVENIMPAADARGLGAMWRTGAMVDEPEVREHLGLGPADAIVAFVYLGRPAAALEPTPRGAPERFVEWRGWGAARRSPGPPGRRGPRSPPATSSGPSPGPPPGGLAPAPS